MISDALQKLAVVIVIFLGTVHPQMPMMPMGYGYGPVMLPPPMPVPVPVGIPMPYSESTTTTTTTHSSHGGDNNCADHQKHPAIAVPMPVPQFVQIAVPSFVSENCRPENKKNGHKNKNCPPCPPCSCNPCTPSFFSFCSLCHQQCRCKNGNENPVPQEPRPPKPLPGPAFPMPIPMPAPAPLVIVPFPPQFAKPQRVPRPHSSDCDSRPVSKSCSEESKPSCSEESKPSCSEEVKPKPVDSCESGYKHKKKSKNRGKSRNKKKKYDIYRRNMDLRKKNYDSDGLVQPVLTYVARNGDVVMKRHLKNDEAHALLGETDQYNQMRLVSRDDSNNRPSVVLMPGKRTSYRRIQKLSNAKHMLNNGRKELVFKTPDNKKISNLSVSFHIAK